MSRVTDRVTRISDLSPETLNYSSYANYSSAPRNQYQSSSSQSQSFPSQSFAPQSFAPQNQPPSLESISSDARVFEAQYDPNADKYLKMNCVDIANHIHYCPVCSQYYKCQRSIYAVIIIVLIVLILLLIKRILEFPPR